MHKTPIWIGFLALLASACAHYPPTPPLDNIDPVIQKSKQRSTLVRKNSDELLLILAFSGGGTRAAALSYGVLKALRGVQLPLVTETVNATASAMLPHTILDEVDFISSVSGGSFTAAYYGLHGVRIFDDFKARLLTYPVQSGLARRVLLSPVNWVRLMSRNFGKSDLAAEYYDKILFEGATFADMNAIGPIVRIQATDVANDFPFSFTYPQFGLICADLDQFPVARAVAASAAFPGPFTPITLHNYAGQCGLDQSQWIRKALIEKETTSREYHTAQKMASYLDVDSRQYIHLLDGGITDNLGVRGPTEILNLFREDRELLDIFKVSKASRIAIIVVNASTPRKQQWGMVSSIYSLRSILGLTSTTMMESYNFETMDLLRQYLRQWERESTVSGNTNQTLQTYLVEVAFKYLPQEEQLAYADIPTSLQLSEEIVDKLIHVAGRLLYGSKQFQELIGDLGGQLPNLSQGQSPGKSNETSY